MSRYELWLVHTSNLAVGGTGVIYALMLYALESEDEFSVVNHPLQPQMQHLHVLLAPLFVFAVGLIWRRHIWSHWKKGVRRGRRSGVSLLLLLLPMILSGYLLQVSVDPRWRQAWEIVHVATSCIWILAFLGHFVAGRTLRRGAGAG